VSQDQRQPARRRIQTTPRELRGQLAILVLVLWSIAAVNIATSGLRLRSGQIKGTDFLHFYALAQIGSTDALSFADSDRVRQAQLHAVPDSTDHNYPPVYGPQVALALAPLARFDYTTALAIWTVLSAGLYAAAFVVALKDAPIVRQFTSVAVLAAAGFPPFWYLLQYGQLSAIALCIVVAAGAALRHGRVILAGALLGILIYKPPLFAPIFAVVLLSGSWSAAAAMVMTGLVELAATAAWVGIEGLTRYVELMLRLPGMAAMMAGKPYQMHSLRAFWLLLVRNSTAASCLYAITAATAILAAAYTWRYSRDSRLRMSALLLAAALAAPHLYVYDLVILAPVWIWLTDWFLEQPLPATFGRVLYLGYVAMLMGGIVQVLPLQVSVICFGYLLFAIPYWQTELREPGRLRTWKATGSIAGVRQRLRGAQ
jgi:hypothetical protein